MTIDKLIRCPTCSSAYAHMTGATRALTGYGNAFPSKGYDLRQDGVALGVRCEPHPEHEFWVVVGEHKGQIFYGVLLG